MTSNVQRATSAMTDLSRPRLDLDPVLGLEEWLWCFDFTNIWCNPSADATPANGTTFRNMARDFAVPNTQAPDGILRNAGATITQAANRGGLIFPAGTKDVTDFVEIGADYMDFSTGNDDYLVIVWDLQPTSGYNTAAYQPILWDTTNNANVASLWIDSGADGKTMRGVLGTGASSAASNGGSTGQGAARQLAFSRIGTQMDFYINGALVNSYGAGPATLQDTDTATYKTKLAANHTGRIYKTAGCRLGGSYDRPVADIVARDWAAKPLALR